MLTMPHFDDSIRPIFIVGAPRSGTSITTWALGQHPNIQPMPETSWLATMAIGGYLSWEYGSARGRFSHLSNVDYALSWFMRRLGESAHRIVDDCFEERCQRLYGDLAPAEAAPLAGEFLIRRRASDPKRRWVDGTPFNTGFAWALSQMFPEAAFIHNLRQPHEVVSSLEAFDKVGSPPQALEEGLQTWMAHTENAWLAERSLGAKRAFRLDFHRLANAPDALFRDVCAFLGEAFSADCLLPLASRINSSDVDDRHAANLSRLRKLPTYQAAKALYERVVACPAGDVPDEAAGELLRTRFVDYSRQHPLV